MKRILAIFLSIALLVTALPSGIISRAEDAGSVNTSITMQADDTRIHRSAAGVKAPAQEIGRYKLETVRSNMTYDLDNANRQAKVCIYNLRTLMTETIGSSTDKGIDRYPYVVTKINVLEADYYNIKVEFNMNPESVVDNMAIVVDGIVHIVQLQKGTDKKQTVGKEIYLSKGEHSILYMSVMPQNESDCPGADANHTNGTCYPWANFWSFTFEDTKSGRGIKDSLEILDASSLTGEDVENIFEESTRIEAEDTKYVTCNIYSNTEGNASASGDTVVGGPSYGQCQQTFEDLSGGVDKDKMPYLQYMVEAPAAGEYYLTIGANAGTNSNANQTNINNPVPFIAVLVNDNAPVKAQFDGAWGNFDSVTVPVQLQKGINIIRCTSVTKGQYADGSSAWVNLDYFEVQKGLTAKPIVVSADDGDNGDYLRFAGGYKDDGDNFGGPTYADMRYDYPSLYEDMLGIYSEVKPERADYWPNIAFTVDAVQAGEYQISAEIADKGSGKATTVGMIVDGAMYIVEIPTTGSALSKTVYLSDGQHVIVFTSPIPRDLSSRPTAQDNSYYQWMNFKAFKLSEGLCFVDGPTDADIQGAMTNYSRMEAEDDASANRNYNADISKEYPARYNKTYTVKIKGAQGAGINGTVEGSETSVNTTQTYADIEAGNLDKELTPYIQYVVKAKTAGKYVLRVGAYVEGSGDMPYGTILVNGKAYKVQFSGNWNGYDAVNLPVDLKAGLNTIQCVGVTADQTSVGTAWIGYDYLDIPEGLTAGSIVVDAEDSDCETYLYMNRYQDSGKIFGGPNYADMRYDYPSLYEDMVGIYSNAKPDRAGYWPYIAFRVRAEQAGEYPISAEIERNTAITLGMIVDGAMYVIDVKSNEVSKSVYLTEGEHTIVFTAPIPRDMELIPAENNNLYPWMNYCAFKLSAGLRFVENPAYEDVQATMTNYSRIEAEDPEHASANENYNADISKVYERRYNKTYTVKVKGFEGAVINGTVEGSETSVNTTQEYAEIEAGNLDKDKTSYIQYTVKTENAGKYVLRVGAYVEGSGDMPYGTILVNGKAYKAQFSGNWNGWDAVNLPVDLREGINTIQCIGVTAEQTGTNGWIGYDYLDIPEGLTATSNVVSAADSDWDNYLYLNRYKDNSTNFGGPNYGDLQWDYPSLYEEMLGIYSDVKPERTNYWPYIAFTVRAEQAGEYKISANVSRDGRYEDTSAKTVGMIVDGAMHVVEVPGTTSELSKTVYLTKGEHVIIFTSPIFRDMVSRPATGGTSKQYIYMDYASFDLSAGLSFVEKPTNTDIQTAMTNYLRIEAEDKDYASANGNYKTEISQSYSGRYHSSVVKIKGAVDAVIDGELSELEKNANSTQKYEDIKTGNLDEDNTSYVQYKVTAEKAGKYVLRIGAYLEGSGDKPYGTILVNGEDAYQAQFSGNWNGYDAVNLAVELQAGENTIQCIGVTADQTDANGWIGYDYLEIPRGLNYHESGEYTNTSVKKGLSFERRTTYETEGAISQEPYTISTWIYLPTGYTSRGGVIFGNYFDSKTPCVSFEVSDNGVPRFYHINGNGEVVNLAFDKASIIADEWTNLTFAISGNSVSCYRNGVLVDTITSSVDITLDAVTNQYVLGGDLRQAWNTSQTNQYYFKGKIIDVALYDTALSAEEVEKVYTGKSTAEPYTRYELENAEKDQDIPDKMKNNNLDGKPSYLTEKEEVKNYAYSFAVVGDTQIVTENDVNKNQTNLSKIYDWILTNKTSKNIQYVFGLGDITDNNNEAEWTLAKEQISKLDGQIPYSVIRGNHDLIGYGTAEDPTADYMTEYLGTDAYKNQFTDDAEEGGFYDANISNSWRTFTVGQVKYLMLALDYGPSDDVLDWAGNIIKEHPEHNVIITTHAYLYRDGTTLDAKDACPPASSGGYNNGDDMWTKLVSKYENIVLVMCGHDPSDNIVMSRDVGMNGNIVTSMLIDPQCVDRDDGSTGMLAMLYFSEDGTQVQVEYFSTVTGEYFKEENQFSFEFSIDDCERKVKEYTAEQVANFKANKKYPKDVEGYEGYLFAGWYTDEACNKESLLNGATPTDTTYALFVPDHVLNVKAQISSNLLNDDTTDDDSAAIRFVTTVDTLSYKQLGLEVSYTGNDGKEYSFESVNSTVYKKLYCMGSDSQISTLTPMRYFCGLSTYFKSCTIINIPESLYDMEFTVKPFWVTMDGDKVFGEPVTKTVAMGIPKEEVWISSDAAASDGMGYGTSENPYQTLNYALSCVKDGGTIHVKDNFTYPADYEWKAHDKDVIITSAATDGSKATLDFSAMSDLRINDGVTFSNIKLKFPAENKKRVFAEGHKLIIEESVDVENNVQLLGGGLGEQVKSTYLEVYSGNYSRIYGGSTGNYGNVTGDTHIIVGGNVNSAADVTSHSKSYCLFGAGWSGTVSGNTYVTVQEGAKFNYVYGGGESENAVVKGSTNVEFAGLAMSIYGGSKEGTNADTHVVMTGGEVEQIFGGCEGTSMTGNTDVRVLGGTVLRRIYGGCYNDYSTSGWAETANVVTGYTGVTFGPEVDGKYATLKTDYKDDSVASWAGIDDATYYAVSRWETNYSSESGSEIGIFIVNDCNVELNGNKGLAGFTDFMESWLVTSLVKPYHYLVNATSGGEVNSAGDSIYIKPDSGYVATVKLINANKSETILATNVQTSYYQLPELAGETVELKVEFSQQ